MFFQYHLKFVLPDNPRLYLTQIKGTTGEQNKKIIPVNLAYVCPAAITMEAYCMDTFPVLIH